MNKFIEIGETLFNINHIRSIYVWDLTDEEINDYGDMSQKLVISSETGEHSIIADIDDIQEMYEAIKDALI